MKPAMYFKLRGLKFHALILSLLFLLSSCIGVAMDIALNQDGSGTIAIEYIISKSLDSLGKLDGNERWNTIPVGRADFMRTLDRIPEMKQLSFSSKESETDFIVNVKMAFKNPRALVAFLDAGGRRSSFFGDANSGSLVLALAVDNNSGQGNSGSLDKLIAVVSEKYQVKVSMSFPNEGHLEITNGRGLSLSGLPGSEVTPVGKKVSFALPLYTVLSAAEGINAEFSW